LAVAHGLFVSDHHLPRRRVVCCSVAVGNFQRVAVLQALVRAAGRAQLLFCLAAVQVQVFVGQDVRWKWRWPVPLGSVGRTALLVHHERSIAFFFNQSHLLTALCGLTILPGMRTEFRTVGWRPALLRGTSRVVPLCMQRRTYT